MRWKDPAIWLILAIGCAAALVWFKDDLWPETSEETPRAPWASVASPAGSNHPAGESLPADPGPRRPAAESIRNQPTPKPPLDPQLPAIAQQRGADLSSRAIFTPATGLLAPGQDVLLASGEDDLLSPMRPRTTQIAATSDLQFRQSSASPPNPSKTLGPSPAATEHVELRTRGPDGSQSQQYSTENRLMIPVAGESLPNGVKLDIQNGLVTVSAHDAPLGEVLGLLAHQQGLNVISGEDIKARVSISLNSVPFADALDNILAIAGYTAVRKNNILLVSSVVTERKVSMQSQGRIVEVFRLNYTTATDVDVVIKGLLSPSGQSFATKGADADNRKTQEMLVVEDVPWNMERIASTIQQMDVAPRQVLIEAHIMSVTLSDDTKCGINLEAMLHGNPALTLRTDGFANAAAFATPGTDQAVFFNLASNDLNLLLEAAHHYRQRQDPRFAQGVRCQRSAGETPNRRPDRLQARDDDADQYDGKREFPQHRHHPDSHPGHRAEQHGDDEGQTRSLHRTNRSHHEPARLANHSGRDVGHAPRRPWHRDRGADPGIRYRQCGEGAVPGRFVADRQAISASRNGAQPQ